MKKVYRMDVYNAQFIYKLIYFVFKFCFYNYYCSIDLFFVFVIVFKQ